MEIFRDLLLIFLAFVCGVSIGQLNGMAMANKNFSQFLKGLMNNEKKENKENKEN